MSAVAEPDSKFMNVADFHIAVHTVAVSLLGLDRYHAGARYPILSAAAVPIPILEITSPIASGERILQTLHIPYVLFKT